MAEALTKAPVKNKNRDLEQKYLDMEFDPAIKYMFYLAQENMEREVPIMEIQGQKARQLTHQRFKPYQNLILTSQIIWNGQRVVIRYYDGCDSLFVSEQPKEKDIIDQLKNQTQPRAFLEGKLGVFGDERMLLLYLNICSWNSDSPFKTTTATSIFVPANKGKIASAEATKLDRAEEALKLAKEATVIKMRIHGGYLGIPTLDDDSGNELTDDEVRIAYRKEALRNPGYFVETYGNKSIEIKYYINKAWAEGLIHNKHNPNKATWGAKNTVICDISGLRTAEVIEQKIFEFSQTDEGQEFAIQLTGIYSK